jgi:phenylalanyl-tRNA synthetase beta chain
VPLCFVETTVYNEDYARYKAGYELSLRGVAQGFYQTLHFAFDSSKNNQKYGLAGIESSLELLNPITAELDTLRISLLPGLIDSVQKNIYKSHKSVALFELGSCFDAKRNESKKAAFVWSGLKEGDDVTNHGKPAELDFKGFLQKLKAIVPQAQFARNTHTAGFIHPYMSGDIVIDGCVIGFAGKLHPKVAAEMDLPATFIAEVNLDAVALFVKKAVPTSKQQRIQRDISVVIDKSVAFTQIKTAVDGLKLPELKACYPCDFYYDDKLGERFSLTLRLVLQSQEDVVSEERSNAVFDAILNTLKEHFKAELR